jgi:hypothetical protein
LIVPCTPDDGVERVRGLLDAGFDYIVFQGVDPETRTCSHRAYCPSSARYRRLPRVRASGSGP